MAVDIVARGMASANSGGQDISSTFNTLNTTNKTIIGAINEHEADITSINSGKLDKPLNNVSGDGIVFDGTNWRGQNGYAFSIIDVYPALIETTLTNFTESSGLYYVTMLTIQMSILDQGESMIISWNGTDYRCECKTYHESEMLCLGNMSLKFDGFEDTGEPFLYCKTYQGDVDVWFTSSNADVDLKVYVFDEYTTKFDKKFIPAITEILSSIAPAYSNISTYEVGDYCMYEYRLYKCNTDIYEAEEWDSTHWDSTTLCGEISNLSS